MGEVGAGVSVVVPAEGWQSAGRRVTVVRVVKLPASRLILELCRRRAG